MNIPLEPPPELNRILVIDDERIVLTALRETLKREGYEVVATTDPLEALAILQREKFSVLLTDQQMATLTGLEFLAQAKLTHPDATRILITAVLDLKTVIDAINQGEIYRFIVKPWLREELLVTVKNAVQRYELICGNTVLYQKTLAMNEQLAAQIAQVEEQNQQLDRLTQALKQNLQHSVRLCVRAMETFYPVLGSQARQTFELCKTMARSLPLEPEQQEALETSAWLHDIGLLGVPRQLIKRWQQSGKTLSEAERMLVEHHPVFGQELVAFVDHLELLGPILRGHHERYDGDGYPDRLSGDQIPWLARLLAVAAAYAAYPGSAKAAEELIQSGSGTAFDPDAVRAFFRSLPQAVVHHRWQEVLLSELRPGMVLAKGIYTANGILLIPEGQVLNAPYIANLHNHNRLTPITQSLLVYC